MFLSGSTKQTVVYNPRRRLQPMALQYMLARMTTMFMLLMDKLVLISFYINERRRKYIRLLFLNFFFLPGIVVWTYLTGGSVGASPVVSASGTVYVGSDDHNIYALDGRTGKVFLYS